MTRVLLVLLASVALVNAQGVMQMTGMVSKNAPERTKRYVGTKRGVNGHDAEWIIQIVDDDGDRVWSEEEAKAWLYHFLEIQVTLSAALEKDEGEGWSEWYAGRGWYNLTFDAIDEDGDRIITQPELKEFLDVVSRNKMWPNKVPHEERAKHMIQTILDKRAGRLPKEDPGPPEPKFEDEEEREKYEAELKRLEKERSRVPAYIQNMQKVAEEGDPTQEDNPLIKDGPLPMAMPEPPKDEECDPNQEDNPLIKDGPLPMAMPEPLKPEPSKHEAPKDEPLPTPAMARRVSQQSDRAKRAMPEPQKNEAPKDEL
jgi:hypothetical protein